MAVDQAGCEHHEGIINAKRCHRFGNVLGGDQGARADDHTGRALVRPRSVIFGQFLRIFPLIIAILSSGQFRVGLALSSIKGWVGSEVTMKFCQLSTRQVAAAKKPGYRSDGAGLYLQISKLGTRSWVFRFNLGGKRREMGLGSAEIVTLKQARQLARDAREHLLRGDDPIAIRQAKRDKVRAELAKRLTFSEALEGCLAARSSEWRSDKHRRQWRSSVEQHAIRVLGQLPVDAIDVPHVLKVLEPIWLTMPETASRVRARIERVLSWATAGKYRHGDNPARWKGALEHLLPATGKVKGGVQHLAALPFADIPEFMAELRARNTVIARAVEFLALTAARSGEVRGARWGEIKGDVWTVPGARTKSGRDHRVPLSERAMAILQELGPARPGKLIFPTGRGGMFDDKPLLVLVKELRPGTSVHGLRSAFRDWAAIHTSYARDVIELCLAHKIKSATEEAYWRDDALEKRRKLMEAWAEYCGSMFKASAEIVPLQGRAQ
jgi:integrase